MKSEIMIQRCDKIMAFSFYAMIYFLPISIALVEIFTVLALLAYIGKRSYVLYGHLHANPRDGASLPFGQKILHFLKAYQPIPNPLNKPIAIFLSVTFLSVLFSQYPSTSFTGFLGKILQSAFLYFNFIECIRSRKRLRIFFVILFISSMLICANGIYQVTIGAGFIHGQPFFNGRMYSSLRQSNDFGAYLITFIPLLLCLFVSRRDKEAALNMGRHRDILLLSRPLKWIYFVLLMVALSCLGMSLSRGAWVGVTLSIFLLGLKSVRILLVSLALAGLCYVVFLPVFYDARPDLVAHKIVRIGPIPFHNLREMDSYLLRVFQFYSNRRDFWRRAFLIVGDYPVLGAGPNTYSTVSRRYSQGSGGYPHNCFLQMAAEIGLIGLTSFFWIIFVLLRSSLRHIRKMIYDSDRMILYGVLSGFVAFLIHSFFDTIMYSVQLGSLMWIFMGLAVSLQKLEDA